MKSKYEIVKLPDYEIFFIGSVAIGCHLVTVSR